VALQWMDEIAAMVGRFVRVDKVSLNHIGKINDSRVFDCYEIDEARAIEKTCQALRDRHYDRHFRNLKHQSAAKNIYHEQECEDKAKP
jgi:hypothetical protein